MKEKEWDQALNVLCIRLDYLGDVLMSTPAIRALKQSLPGRSITLLTSDSGYAAAGFIPELDDAIAYSAPWMKTSLRHGPDIDMAMIQELRSRKFDAAAIFTSYSQSPLPAATLCYLAEIPLRLAHCRENPYHLLNNWVHDPEPQELVRHEVRRQLDLVGAIGSQTRDERLSFALHSADTLWASRRLQALGIDPAQPWLLFHPGASAPSRRYPPQLWSQVARQLISTLGCPVIFTGDTGELPLIAQIQEAVGAPSHSLAGKLTLGRLAAMIALAPVIVCNNTGPAHLAAALGTPVVDLYALTNPQHTPWQVPSRVLFHEVPCRLCYKSICPQGHHDCLTKIPPDRVVKETLELLNQVSRCDKADRAAYDMHAQDKLLRAPRDQSSSTTRLATPITLITPGDLGAAADPSHRPPA
jgi:lipopolysaccharide heptosyltransferase II